MTIRPPHNPNPRIVKEEEEEQEVVLIEEGYIPTEGEVMVAKIAGERRVATLRRDTPNKTQIGGNMKGMTGNQDPLGLVGVPDPQATPGGIENGNQDITPDGRIPETE